MRYSEYIKSEFERAVSENEWFDPKGNSITATVNRSVVASMLLDVKRLAVEFVDIELKELFFHVVKIILFIFSPVLFLPVLFLRAYFTKKRATKEMMGYYEKQKDKKS